MEYTPVKDFEKFLHSVLKVAEEYGINVYSDCGIKYETEDVSGIEDIVNDFKNDDMIILMLDNIEYDTCTVTYDTHDGNIDYQYWHSTAEFWTDFIKDVEKRMQVWTDTLEDIQKRIG